MQFLRISMIHVVIIHFLSVFYSSHALAIDIRVSTPDYYNTHDPGVIPESLSFPLVYYLVGDKQYLQFTLSSCKDQSQYPDIVNIPEYLGYLVFEADLSMRFVSKSPWAAPLADIILNLFAGDKIFQKSPIGEELWLPRKSWNGLLEVEYSILFNGNIMAPRGYITMGAPPDDSFIPIFTNVYRSTKQQLLDYHNSLPDRKHDCEIILNNPEGAQLTRHIHW